MLHGINRRAVFSARILVGKSAAGAMFARNVLRGIFTTAHNTLSLLGLSALFVLAILTFKPELAREIQSALPFAGEIETPGLTATNSSQELKKENQVEPAIIPVSANDKPLQVFDRSTMRQQQWVSNWLSKRYRVAGDAANMLVLTSYLTAREIKIDPLLILAVMAIESGFNPFAESPMGAQGLMQVMSKIHHEKFQDFGGIKEALNPHANIRVGALILKDYVTRGGSVEAGLKSYVGAAAFSSDSGYGSRVLAEYQRLKDVASGKAVPTNFGSGNVVRQRPIERNEDKASDPAPANGEQLAAL